MRIHNGEPEVRERSPEWLKERIAYLKAKKADLVVRSQNIDEEIAERTKELGSKARAAKKVATRKASR